MLVNHLGGKVEGHDDGLVEIGWYPLKATEEGKALMHWPEMVYQFHREGFSLPTGATLLATAETYPNQAFRYGDNAWGIQFHAELTRVMMQRWVVRGAHRFELPGAQPGRDHLGGRLIWDMHLKRWLDGVPGDDLRQRRPRRRRRPSSSRPSRWRICAVPGNSQAQRPATATAPTPPKTTAGTVPISAAMVPARNSPSSFDAPTKTMLTALTRPRTSSGVQSWISVSRT